MAKDKIHEIVKNALIQDGWTITDDPYTIEYKEVTLFADLGAEKLFSAEQNGRKIVVEVKSFSSISKVQDLKLALGQYKLYNVFLKRISSEHKLYLAVGKDIYEEFFTGEAIDLALRELEVSVIIVNLETEVISEWIR